MNRFVLTNLNWVLALALAVPSALGQAQAEENKNAQAENPVIGEAVEATYPAIVRIEVVVERE